jgi:hypothetical protein
MPYAVYADYVNALHILNILRSSSDIGVAIVPAHKFTPLNYLAHDLAPWSALAS